MKVFVTGVNGQLGHDVMNELAARGHEAIGSDLSEAYSGIQDGSAVCSAPYYQLNILDRTGVREAIFDLQPDAVIHCAAWTNVDAAEEPENKEKVLDVNGNGTSNIVDACNYIHCKMMYISTDYVFAGQGTEPWDADCHEYDPLNVYGFGKLMGELVVKECLEKFFVVRISWVFGRNGNNFIKTMLNVGKKYPELRVVNDQIGRPTYTLDLARLLTDMIETEKYGFYNATNEGDYISWYDFACEIFRQAGYDTKVIPVTTEEYGVSKAARPFNSRLATGKLAANGFTPLPEWQDALKRYLKDLES